MGGMTYYIRLIREKLRKFRTDNISLETSFYWLSDDIVTDRKQHISAVKEPLESSDQNGIEVVASSETLARRLHHLFVPVELP